MDENKISVIIPIYNTEKNLEACVESILKQTYRNLEVILINDGSTDNSGEICDTIAKSDNRVVVIHKLNEGVSAARNTGIDRATGDFIGFVDSDDIIDEDMYEILIRNAIINSADISHCGYMLHTGGMLVPKYGTNRMHIYDNLEGLKAFILGKSIEPGLCNKIYKKEMFDCLRLDESIRINEDFLMNYYLFKKAKKSVFYDICKYHYIQREGSVTMSKLSEKQFDQTLVSDILIDDLKEDKELWIYSIHKKVRVNFTLINRIIENNKFYERYNDLRREVLSYKKNILLSSLFPMREKVATLILWLMPGVYSILIKIFK